jgi:hemerythrin superfamily protein
MNEIPHAARSSEEIQMEIDDTRAQLDRTLDALQSRLSPRERVGAVATAARERSVHAMHAATRALSPDITTMIRMDHTHALALFRRLRPGTSVARKRALAANVCLALEIHARLEEEIFYPALREAIGANEMLDKSVPEHDEMRMLISKLRSLEPLDAGFDDTCRALMRAVLHHVADEESTLLPQAEESMADRLTELGVKMTKRRMELLKPHLAEVAITSARSFPVATAAITAGVIVLAWLALKPRRLNA